MQLTIELINHEVSGTFIQQRPTDGYINASQLCLAAGSGWHRYIGNEAHGHFIKALSESTGLTRAQLIVAMQTESGEDFWVHPTLASHVAQWLSPQFAIKVNEWVVKWANGTQAPARTYHIDRYVMNAGQVPAGYFSILQEMTFLLIAPLEQQGYILPAEMVPDISMGMALSKYLREKLGVDTSQLPVYDHIYPDGRVIEARCYPEEYLAVFRQLIRGDWLPNHAPKYFAARDTTALPHLNKLTLLPPPKASSRNKLGSPPRR